MIERDTFGSSLSALMTGVAVTSGPWLLTTALLVLMRVVAVAAGIDAVTSAEHVITVVYATVIVFSSPINIVLTRYAADCVYERRCERIAAPLCRTAAMTLIAFAIIGGSATHMFGVGPALSAAGAVIAAIVGAQWLLLSAAGGLSAPGIVLRAFALGAPVSLAFWLAIAVPLELGPVGYLLGFGAGQFATLALLLHGTLRALPPDEDTTASLGHAAREYIVLAAAALAFNAGLWIDKLIVLWAGGGELASQYAALAAVAWLSIIPACAFLFIVVETEFHRRFDAFYSALRAGAPLATLETLERALRSQVETTVRQTMSIQLGVTLVCLLAAPAVAESLGLGGAPRHTITWLVAGAGLQMIALSTILLLYYFDLRREALIAAVTQLVANALLTLHAGAPSELLGAGYAAACALSGLVSVAILRASLPNLLPRTLQSQPELT